MIYRQCVMPGSDAKPTDRRAGKRTSPGRPTEKVGVRVATGLFEDAGMIVQQVDQANDIGKDLYVDLADRGVFTGDLIALQVKSGLSYRRGSGYRIPCSTDDLALWAGSSVPIFGVVYDPERDRLCWLNLTAWARAQPPGAVPGAAELAGTWVLDPRTLANFVREARAFLGVTGPPALLGLVDDDLQRQRAAVYDAFALGRRDARSLILLRRAILHFRDPQILRPAIHFLTLTVGHMDIFWHSLNWIDDEIRRQVRPYLDWTPEELRHLLTAPSPEEWTRGGLGQDVAAIVCANWGRGIERSLEQVALEEDESAAWPALMLLVTSSDRDQLETIDRLVPHAHTLGASAMIHDLRATVAEHGYVSMW